MDGSPSNTQTTVSTDVRRSYLVSFWFIYTFCSSKAAVRSAKQSHSVSVSRNIESVSTIVFKYGVTGVKNGNDRLSLDRSTSSSLSSSLVASSSSSSCRLGEVIAMHNCVQCSLFQMITCQGTIFTTLTYNSIFIHTIQPILVWQLAISVDITVRQSTK